MIQLAPFAFLMNQTPMQLFVHGGPIMWPILIVSLVAVTIGVERVIFAIREARSRNNELVEKMFERVEADDIEGAIALGKESNDFVARILVYALTHKDSSLSNAFLRSANQELSKFSLGIAALDTCITAAPLLGLLGTVTGMMKTFGNMTGDIAAAASSITGGVAEALIATAAGLAIAVAGLMPFNYINTRLEKARHEVEDAGNALELILKKKSNNGGN